MCGICGLIYKDETRNISEQLLDSMVNVLRHRGPDDSGVWIDGNAALGQTRLSIIDLSSAGHQPMPNIKKNVWITFNGEIYNYKELRDDLKKRGYIFNSQTDTEVVVNLWMEYGENCVDHLRGMFAIAIWDKQRKCLFLARDRFGQKPLFYADLANRFIFGSEPKAILQDPEFVPEPDLQGIHHYLAYQSVPAPYSAFKGIKKLPPAHCLLFKNRRTIIRRYWKLSYAQQIKVVDEEELKREIIDRLKESVRIRLMSDVPLGAFLSGGIDSSLIVALMASIMDNPVKTFTIGFNEKEYDETNYARMVAERYQTEHHQFIVTPDARDIFHELIWHYNEPFADPSAIPTYYLSKLAREHVTVVLSGDAGDENFAGYERYHNQGEFPLKDNFPTFEERMKMKEGKWAAYVRGVDNEADIRRLKEFDQAKMLYYYRIAHWHEEFQMSLYTPEMFERLGGACTVDLMLERFRDSDAKDFVSKALDFDLGQYLPDTLMTKVDIASMAHSLEARTPMLDHHFAQFVATIPSEYKLKDGRISKYILKKACERYLPNNVIYRSKMGFGVPLEHWFRNELCEMAYDLLLSKKSIEREYFKGEHIQNLLDRHQRGENWQYLLWNLLMLEQWHLMFIDKTITIPKDNDMTITINKDNNSESKIMSNTSASKKEYCSTNINGIFGFSEIKDPVKVEKNMWMVSLPSLTEMADNSNTPNLSFLMLYENGIPIGPPHSLHDKIKNKGKGAFSHWQEYLYFSTSDNSNPISNGNIYTYSTSGLFYHRAMRDIHIPNIYLSPNIDGSCENAEENTNVPVNLSSRDNSDMAIKNDVEYAVKIGKLYKGYIDDSDKDPKGLNILEIGPGINFGSSLYLACYGAKIAVTDRFLSPWIDNYHHKFYRSLYELLKQNRFDLDLTPLKKIVRANEYPDDVLTTYQCSLEEASDIPDNTFDIILSNAVLEHVYDVIPAVTKLYRITKPGGIGFHQIDHRDHRDFSHPLEYLILSDDEFKKKFWESHCEMGNRLRQYEVEKIFKNVGFEIQSFDGNMFTEDEYLDNLVSRLKTTNNTRYQNCSREQLKCISGLFKITKPKRKVLDKIRVTIDRILLNKSKKAGEETEVPYCAEPWRQMIIDLTGEVVPCCYWSGYGNTGKPLGNTNKNSLNQIWNNRTYRKLRKINASGNLKGSPCENCMSYRWANETYPAFQLSSSFSKESGFCYMVQLPDAILNEIKNSKTKTTVLEDGIKLPHPNELHDNIRKIGQGRYSIWHDTLYLSSSDNSNPIWNNKKYQLDCNGKIIELPQVDLDSVSGKNIRLAYREYKKGKRYMKAKASKLTFISSSYCNIDCPHCSQTITRIVGLGHRPKTEQDVMDHIPFITDFTWHGGEPFVLKNFRKFLNEYKREDNPNLRMGFTTNGTLLRSHEIELLKKFTAVNASISIDSFKKETFQKIRAGANYEKVIANTLNCIRDYDANWIFNVGMCIMKSNILELPDNLRYAFEHDIGLNLSPILISPVFERLDIFSNFELQTQNWEQAITESLAIVADAKNRSLPAVKRIDPEGMIHELHKIYNKAKNLYTDALSISVKITDPTASLKNMLNPCILILANDEILSYAMLNRSINDVYYMNIPRQKLTDYIKWTLVHNTVEDNWGFVIRHLFCNERNIPLRFKEFQDLETIGMELEIPRFLSINRPMNTIRPREASYIPKNVSQISKVYHDLRKQEVPENISEAPDRIYWKYNNIHKPKQKI